MFQKGDRVRLNEYGLNFIYPYLAGKPYRDRAARKVFIVVGRSRDKQSTRVTTEGGNPNTQESYHNSFLEKVNPG